MRVPLAAVTLVGLMGSAFAADLPPPSSAAPYSFAGVYSGLFAGYGSLDNAARPMCSKPADPEALNCLILPAHKLRVEDFTAGSEIGYNLPLTPGSGVVIGAAADYQFTRLRGYGTLQGYFTIPDTGETRTVIHHAGQRLDFLGTLRGKIGYAFDRFFVYGTGGLAYGNVRIDTNTAFPLTPSFSVDFEGRKGELRTGYVAGGGIEYAFSQRLSAKVEGLYYDLGARSLPADQIFGQSPYRYGARVETSGYLARAGLNYRFGDGLPLLDLVRAVSDPAPSVPISPATWTFEAGLRYFYSSGLFRDTLGAPGNGAQTNSRLTYQRLGAHSSESFARLDHTPTGLFLKGFLGAGFIDSGSLIDEDYPPGTVPYSKTVSGIRNGDIGYAVVDAGLNLLRGESYKLGGYLGYQYFAQLANGFGCNQVASGEFCAEDRGFPDSVSGLSVDAHWNAFRVGLIGEMRLDRVKFVLEGAYLPVAEIEAYDRHWQRSDINPMAMVGSGDGYFLQGVISYDLTPSVAVGIGARYWKMQADRGHSQFPFPNTPPSPVRFETDRYGGFAQISYTLSDLGFGDLAAR